MQGAFVPGRINRPADGVGSPCISVFLFGVRRQIVFTERSPGGEAAGAS